MTCKQLPQNAEHAEHLEPAARASTTCKHDQPARQHPADPQLLRRGAQRARCPPSRGSIPADAVSEHPPANVRRRRELRHRPDQHDHARARLEVDRDLPRLGRLGRLLRPRRSAARSTRTATGCACPGIVISPYARHGYVDHQTLSFDAYLKFIEDDFLGGRASIRATDGRPDSRPDVRENAADPRQPRQRLQLPAEATQAADPAATNDPDAAQARARARPLRHRLRHSPSRPRPNRSDHRHGKPRQVTERESPYRLSHSEHADLCQQPPRPAFLCKGRGRCQSSAHRRPGRDLQRDRGRRSRRIRRTPSFLLRIGFSKPAGLSAVPPSRRNRAVGVALCARERTAFPAAAEPADADRGLRRADRGRCSASTTGPRTA